MQINKLKASTLIIVVVAVGITAGVMIYDDLNQPDIHLGYLQGDIHHLAFFVAQEKGYYTDEGLNVTAHKFSNGGAVMAAFESAVRTIDMSYLGFAPAIGHKFNVPTANITVVSGVNVEGSALVVKNDGSINSVADLNGKIIAVPAINNMQDFILRMALDTDPLMDYDDNITTIRSLVTMMGLSLKTGSIDGYVAWEPYNAREVIGADPVGKYLLNSSTLWPDHPCCVIAAHDSFLQSHPEIVEKILRVHVKATQFINNPANHDEVIQIAINQLGITSEVAEVAIRNVGYIYEPDLSKMIQFLDKLVEFGSVSMDTGNVPSSITTHSGFIDYFIDTAILDQVTSSI
jgi:NitT/TauT family transport system substrate-binding protein